MTEELSPLKNMYCPNCRGPAVKAGNEITCEACDVVFVITEKRGAQVKELGPFEKLDKRVAALEVVIGSAGTIEPEPAEPDSQDDETEEEIVPR